jgi:hypothetical protein
VLRFRAEDLRMPQLPMRKFIKALDDFPGLKSFESPTDPGILPRNRKRLVISAKPDICAVGIAELQRLMLADGNGGGRANT